MRKIKFGLLLLIFCSFLSGCSCEKKEAASYTITFNSNGSSAVESQTIKENGVVVKPVDPKRDGYTFLGWYLNLDDDTAYDFSSKVTGNITLYAKWGSEEEPEQKDTRYTITLNVEGKLTTIKTNEKGLLKMPEDPKLEGFEFVGWYQNNKKVDFSKPFTSNGELIAMFTYATNTNTDNEKPASSEEIEKPEEQTKPTEPTEVKYKVKFTVDGKVVSSYEAVKGSKITLPKNPTKAGYTFRYWNSAGKTVTNSTTVTKDMNIVGEWDAYTFEVSLINENQSQSPQRKATVYKNGSAITAKAIYGDNNASALGTYSADFRAIKIYSIALFEKANNYKVELNDGTKVIVSK